MQIVTRAQWGAAPPLGPLDPWPAGEPTGHTIHWEGSGGNPDHGQCANEVRSIQAYHQHTGYYDIAYNWVVCIHGVVFEGRQVHSFRSAAQRDGNPLRVAVCYMAGPAFPFTPAGAAAIAGIIGLDPPSSHDQRPIGHRDEPSCSTSCPGDAIEAWIHQGVPMSPPPVNQPGPTPPPNPLPPQGFHHPQLQQGSVGPAVMELQRKLNAVAHLSLSVDGKFGPLTANAVREFQTFFKLGVDGIAGPKTWGMLDLCAALRGVH